MEDGAQPRGRSLQQVQRAEELFRAIDTRDAGMISVDDLRASCREHLGMDISDEDLQRMVRVVRDARNSPDDEKNKKKRKEKDDAGGDEENAVRLRDFVRIVERVYREEDAVLSLEEVLKIWVETEELLDEAATILVHPPSDRISILESLIAGGAAGAIAKSAIAPLDRVKILFQTNPNLHFSVANALRDGRQIYKNDGIKALWKGNAAMMLKVIPYAAIQYMTFEQLKHFWLGPDREFLSPLERVILGSFAGASSVAVTYPLDLLRARFAVQRGHNEIYTSLWRAFNHIRASEGILSLYRGLGASILGIIPYGGLSFGTFETLKYFWLLRARSSVEERDRKKLTASERFVSGAFAGLVAQSVTYPLDVARRRMQVDSSGKYKEVTSTIVSILREEGIRQGLFKGLALNWIKGPIALGISFSIYDFFSTHLHECAQKISMR